MRRGIELQNPGTYDSAIVYYDKAIEIKPEDYLAWILKASTYSQAGQFEKSIKCYQTLLTFTDSFHPTAWYYYCIADCYACMKDKANMLKYLKNSIDIDDKFKKSAKEDKDFQDFWADPDFKKLAGDS